MRRRSLLCESVDNSLLVNPNVLSISANSSTQYVTLSYKGEDLVGSVRNNVIISYDGVVVTSSTVVSTASTTETRFYVRYSANYDTSSGRVGWVEFSYNGSRVRLEVNQNQDRVISSNNSRIISYDGYAYFAWKTITTATLESTWISDYEDVGIYCKGNNVSRSYVTYQQYTSYESGREVVTRTYSGLDPQLSNICNSSSSYAEVGITFSRSDLVSVGTSKSTTVNATNRCSEYTGTYTVTAVVNSYNGNESYGDGEMYFYLDGTFLNSKTYHISS